MYTEASSGRIGSKASLVSPNITTNDYVSCLSFWYHMYGDHTGTLRVFMLYDSNVRRISWYKAGDQGDRWRNALMNLVPYSNFSNMQLVWEVERGIGYKGDIAIDDIKVMPGKCNSLSK